MLTFIANGLSERGYSVFIYTYEDTVQHYKLNENIKHMAEKKISKTRAIRRFIQVFQIKKVIKSIKPDVVISFLNNPNLLCILATLFSKNPIIISERGDPYQGKGLFNKFRKIMYRFADGTVFQTEGARNYFGKTIRDRSTIIPNPVTIKNKSQPVLQRTNEIAFVGRFELVQKRQDLMLLAFRKVVNAYPELKLVFYGDGPDEQKVRDITKQLGLSENVCFPGLVNNVQESISGARMFVLTSDYEGIPNALIEAMALGLPVVATDCSPGGARLLIEDKKNGILVPIGDVDAIANAIIFLIENQEIAQKYGERATVIKNKVHPEKIIDMWDEYIKTVIK